MKCWNCGHEIQTEIQGPWRCVCKAWSRVDEFQATCQHRGPSVGIASCGCGMVYECRLLNKLCSNRKPPDEWADVNGRFLTAANYQCCGECEAFSSHSQT